MGTRDSRIGLLLVVVFAIGCFTGLVAAAVDDFESYALDTVLDGVGGWATYSSLDGNSHSPIVNDSTSGYLEFNGKFIRFINDNFNGNIGEMVVKDSFSILSKPGEYVQLAMYMSSETVDGDSPSAELECRVLDGANSTLRFGMSWDYRTGNLAHWYYNNGTEHHTNFPVTINNPCPDANRPLLDNWYVLRATLRDADSDDVVDSYDLETFDANMNPLWYELGISTVGCSVCEKVAIGATGGAGKSVGLIDEIKFNKTPVNYTRPSSVFVVDDFEPYSLLTILENIGGWSEGWYGINSNLSSPIVKDGNTSPYPEFDGQFITIIDNNADAKQSEVTVKSSFVTPYEHGDYVQTAIYMSSECPADPCYNGTLGGTVEFRILEGIKYVIRVGGSWDYRDGNLAHWFCLSYGGSYSRHTAFPGGNGSNYIPLVNPCPDDQRPRLNEWYIIRVTLRDNDDNGIVESYDFETFDADMNPLWYELNIWLYYYEAYTICEKAMFVVGGSSSVAVALADEVLFSKASDAPPASCSEVWAKGYGLAGDLDEDCRVDISGDLLPMVTDWLSCNDPEDANCTPNW